MTGSRKQGVPSSANGETKRWKEEREISKGRERKGKVK